MSCNKKKRSAGAAYYKCCVLEQQTVFFSPFQGATVWIPDPDAVWVSAVLLQAYSPGEKQLRLQLSDGKVRNYKTK